MRCCSSHTSSCRRGFWPWQRSLGGWPSSGSGLTNPGGQTLAVWGRTSWTLIWWCQYDGSHYIISNRFVLTSLTCLLKVHQSRRLHRLHHPTWQLTVHHLHHLLSVQEVRADTEGLLSPRLVKHLPLLGKQAGLRCKSKNPLPQGGVRDVWQRAHEEALLSWWLQLWIILYKCISTD